MPRPKGPTDIRAVGYELELAIHSFNDTPQGWAAVATLAEHLTELARGRRDLLVSRRRKRKAGY